MEIIEAMKTRKTIRGFLPKPVPRQVFEQVLELAGRSPSWSNVQPWEVTVVGGESMEQLKAALVQAVASGTQAAPDIPYPRYNDPYLSRMRDAGLRLYASMGISREDREKRQEWTLKGYRFFDAPNGVILSLDEELGQWSVLDTGIFLQSFLLAAWNFGLGACPSALVVGYPKVLRSVLGIPDKKKIICGMAVGYPDVQFPANKFEIPREPVANISRWCGF